MYLSTALIIGLSAYGVAPEPGLLAQSPSPAYVNLPSGWTVEYPADGPPRGEIVGPDGFTLKFSAYASSGPAYGGIGMRAAHAESIDDQPVVFRAILDGRLVQMTYTEAMSLAISYPPDPSQSEPEAFDYWIHPSSQAQSSLALAVALTYLDARPGNAPPLQGSAETPAATADRPFAYLGTGSSYSWDSLTSRFVRIRAQDSTSISEVSLTTEAIPTTATNIFAGALLGGTLQVAEGQDDRLWAKYTRPSGSSATFVMTSTEFDAALLTVLAAVTFSPPQ